MLGTVLEVLDSSIVNVSLPHMQGSFSASVDEIAWVVTSYLVAAGIMIPMTGWIAGRFGRKRYFIISITTFIASSKGNARRYWRSEASASRQSTAARIRAPIGISSPFKPSG